MELPTHLNTEQLRHGLAQMLRAYSGAGLKRFNRSLATDIDSNVLEQLSALGLPDAPGNALDQAAPSSARAVGVDSRIAQISPAELVGTHHAARGASLEGAATAPPTVQPHPEFVGDWLTPALSLPERELRLRELDAQVRACRKCEELVCYRRQTVFGDGHLSPRVCFYGEAPGADEDAQGKPFVGAAGKLLTDIIRAMRLSREEVYILNSLKCRPPQNRTPLPEEVENCRPYALEQLEILQPEFIILLGAVAVRSVLQSTLSVGRLRGRFHPFRGARVLVTYHPAYLLRNPEAKKLVWADVQLVMRELAAAPTK